MRDVCREHAEKKKRNRTRKKRRDEGRSEIKREASKELFFFSYDLPLFFFGYFVRNACDLIE